MNEKLLIFDMDGTLVDTRHDITTSINYVRGLKNMPPLTQNEVLEIINHKREELAKKLYDTDSYLPEDRAVFEEHYRDQCTKNVVPFDGVVETLTVLKKTGAKMSVATNAPTEFGERILKAAGIEYFFDFIIGACKVNNPKPDSEMIYLIGKLYNCGILNCESTFIIGDNYTDITAGKNAGIKSVFANWGYGKFHEEAKPHYQAGNFSEILKIVA